jgi:hypothetical protein
MTSTRLYFSVSFFFALFFSTLRSTAPHPRGYRKLATVSACDRMTAASWLVTPCEDF